MEEVLFETESRQSRAAVADYLRTVADRLDAGETLTLAAGDREFSLDVPGDVAFEVKVERESGTGADELSVELELEWDEGDGGDDSLTIE